MRLRKIKNAEEIIAKHDDLVLQQPEQYKGKWKEVFQNENPIHIEVGMGKGQFLYQLALRYPEINYIGIEVVPSVMVRAVEKYVPDRLPNVRLLCVNAEQLVDIFEDEEVSQIYLNFSDPWPKNRHEKRRLTYKRFLAIFEQILIPNGEIHFKTDNRGLFEYSIISMTNYGMKLIDICLNLHQSGYEDNIMTEYEERFVSLNHPIYYLVAHFGNK